MEQFIRKRLREAFEHENGNSDICDHLTAKNYQEIYNWLQTAQIPQVDSKVIAHIMQQLQHALSPNYAINSPTSSIGTNTAFPDDLDTALIHLQSILCG